MNGNGNSFKEALLAKKAQIGLWLSLPDPYCAEVSAGAGFDWLLLDGEHAPNDLRTVLAQLQAIEPYPVHPVVRPSIGETHYLKQYLDLGVQTLLIPMVDTAAQARELVAAVQYPPKGVRGVGSFLARTSRWGRVKGYPAKADDEVCLLLQVETVTGMKNIEAIAATPGVDGVFIGPADLAASMGYLNEGGGHPEVVAAVKKGFQAILAAGKAPGILTMDETLAREYLALGALFVAVGADVDLLARATETLAARFK
ncbi:putative 2,4-dihydroxyhept-2-ene-1,7-dioic acid-like aldolase [uncultured delta proteobacterium]|uniref:Putative 2,4-dihydroxyhept-2-ene-1,7-dioic acid-like aldolase n=1 Tax=uncultured delta proteobacterium TaxID=34034 RepID=A0A212KHB8_9DELT|nr:putative 2,4-dihydroxyhept-2-ene-1,7-dioic acid-like aldolase [uncultured delta proteobacterium]